MYTWHVENAAQVAELIKAVKHKYYGAVVANVNQLLQQQLRLQQTELPAGPAEVRLHVTLASRPDAPPKIVMVNAGATTMAVVVKAVAAKLQVPFSADLELQVTGVGSVIETPGELSADDKLVLVGGLEPPGYTEKH
jgi:hypothetical protein